MDEKKKKQHKPAAPRQSWEPHWSLRLLKALWMVCFTAFKIALGAVATVLCICVICGLVFASILGDYLQQDIIPEAYVNLDEYDQDLTSFLYYKDEDGNYQQWRQIYTDVDRQYAYYEEIPEDLIHAAVAIEDKRFYEHQGVDWFTTVKACANIFFGGGDIAGGSTITQQLVKNVTKNDSVTVQRKVTEIFSALEVERDYDKEFIMERYLNEIYLGQDCYGVKSAAATYFGKELSDLTTAECASLISITNNPSLYDPYGEEFDYDGEPMTGAERNRVRQLLVLDQMLKQEWITQKEYDEAVAQEMVFKSGIDEDAKNFACANPECEYVGKKATYIHEGDAYYCPVCETETNLSMDNTDYVYSWFEDTVLEDVAKALAEQRGMEWSDSTREACMQIIQRGGYHIYTTVDMKVQNQVDAIYKNLEEIPEARSKQQLQSAIVVVDNRTGDVVAMSGGVGEKVDFDAYNRATDAELQTGSSIKPITVYAPAFELGIISPATVIKDLPLNYDDGAWPLNDDREYNYARTILQGVTSSVNAIAVNVLDTIGANYSFDFAKDKFGLSTLVESYIRYDGFEMSDRNLSALGLGAQTFGCTVRDMTNAFATFANHGEYRYGRTFVRVYDSDGNVVLDNPQVTRQILSEKTINYMNYCLDNAVNSGTGSAADLSGMAVAGKTGSTSDWKDRWFCGFTGYYTAAVWVGYDTPEEINLVGNYSNPACRLWKKVMAPLHEGLESIPLYDSSNFSSVSVCLDSGKRATDACKLDVRDLNRVASAYAYWEDAPDGYCDKHVLVDYCVTGGGVATEYCSKFPDVQIEKRALVKMTQDEIDELKKAARYNLDDDYLVDTYVYLVTSSGQDAPFHGFNGDINVGINAPYAVCPVHTKEAWEALQTKPTDPTVPTGKPVG